jgi:hypothetical protein
MTLTAEALDLATMTLGQLCDAYDTRQVTGDAMCAEVERRKAVVGVAALRAELDQVAAERRERARRNRLADRTRALQAAYWTELEAHVAAAEAQTNGYFLSPAGRLAVPAEATAHYLWTCRERDAWKWASEELRAFWDANGRLTFGTYRRQLAATGRAAREEHEAAKLTARLAVWRPVAGGKVRACTVRVNGAPRRAWWALSASGVASLHETREAACSALSAAPAPVAAAVEAPATAPACLLATARRGHMAAVVAAMARRVAGLPDRLMDMADSIPVAYGQAGSVTA